MSTYWNDELCHYGVLGMRWGVRRGRAEKAYGRASKKLAKLSNQIEKHQSESTRYVQKSENLRHRPLFSSKSRADEALARASKEQYKANQKMRKAKKWIASMEKEFSTTSIKLSQEQLQLGKDYANRLSLASSVKAMTY